MLSQALLNFLKVLRWQSQLGYLKNNGYLLKTGSHPKHIKPVLIRLRKLLLKERYRTFPRDFRLGFVVARR